MTTLMLEERRLKHGRTITPSHSLINNMTHRLSTPDAGTLPVHQTSHNVQKIYTKSDHRPAYLTLEAETVQASALPMWNYKKAKWPLSRHRTSILTNSIQVYDRDMTIVIKELKNYVLQAAKECIPKGPRKDYTPYWNEDLNNKHNELTTARNLADVASSIENNTALKKTNAKFIKTRNEYRRSSWMKKTASLNMESDSNKLWHQTKQLNDKENRHAKITHLHDRKVVHVKQIANIFADTYKEVIYQLSYTNKSMCAQNRERLLSLMMCHLYRTKN